MATWPDAQSFPQKPLQPSESRRSASNLYTFQPGGGSLTAAEPKTRPAFSSSVTLHSFQFLIDPAANHDAIFEQWFNDDLGFGSISFTWNQGGLITSRTTWKFGSEGWQIAVNESLLNLSVSLVRLAA